MALQQKPHIFKLAQTSKLSPLSRNDSNSEDPDLLYDSYNINSLTL